MNFRKRWRNHKGALARGTHHSPILQNSWAKNGSAVFEFKVLLLCAPKDLIDYEQRCIDRFKPAYNVCPVAGSTLGVRQLPEHVSKRALANTGRVHGPEARANMSAGKKGVPFSEEHKAKLSVAGLLRWQRSGPRPHTQQTKDKIGAAVRFSIQRDGSPRTGSTQSPETRAKIGASNRARRECERAAGVTRVISVETKAKLSAATTLQWQRRKANQGELNAG